MRAIVAGSHVRPWLLLLLAAGLGWWLSPRGPATADEGNPPAEPARWTAHPAGLEIHGLSSLVMHPRAEEYLYANVGGLGVARSEDGGVTWTVLHEGLDPRHVPGPRTSVQIALDLREEKTIWLVTAGHVYRSEDRGDSWEHMSTGALASRSWDRRRDAMMVRGVVVDPRKSLHVLAGTRTGGTMRGGLFESTNGGKSWVLIAGSDEEDSNLGHDAWPILIDPNTEKNVAVGGADGFWLSDDRGRTFRRYHPGEAGDYDVRALVGAGGRSREIFLCDARGVWSSRDFGKRWSREPDLAGDAVAVAPDPNSRRRVYAWLRGRGLLVSDDARHEEWEVLGHAEVEAREILVHPRDEDVIYLASPVTGLHVSEDQGLTFKPVASNIGAVVPSMVAVAADPGNVNGLLALSAGGLAFVSSDRGETWERAGLVYDAPTVLVALAGETTTWLAAGGALSRSVDGGFEWEAIYEPEDPGERIVRVRAGADGALWLLLERSKQVVRSEDGGETWTVTKPPTNSSGTWARCLAVDAANPQHLLTATYTRAHLWSAADKDGGPYESWDGGETWSPLLEGLSDGRTPKRYWNAGRTVRIHAPTGLLVYAADGLGVFARLAADPEGEPPEEAPAWVDVSPSVPSPEVQGCVLLDEPAEGAAFLYLQVRGANDTRTFVRARLERLRQRVVEGAQEDEPPLWEPLPAPPAPIACLDADPHVPGRLLAADRDGTAGILVYDVPGREPPAPEEPAEVPGEAPAEGPRPPEGLLGFSCGADGIIRVWNLREGKLLTNLPGHLGEVFATALAPDESFLATGSADRSVRLWSASDGTPGPILAPEEYESAVNALLFGPESRLLYAGLEEAWAVLEWEPSTGASRRFDGHTGGVLSLALSADGKRVVSGSRDQTIRVWDVESAQPTGKIDFGAEVLALALSGDGTRIYAGGRDPAVRVFALPDGQEEARIETPWGYVSALALGADGSRLYVAGEGGVRAYDAATLTQTAQYGGSLQPILSLAVARDDAWLLAGDAENGLWLWARGEATPFWSAGNAHAGAIHAVALTPDVTEAPPGPGEEGSGPPGGEGGEAPPPEEGPGGGDGEGEAAPGAPEPPPEEGSG